MPMSLLGDLCSIKNATGLRIYTTCMLAVSLTRFPECEQKIQDSWSEARTIADSSSSGRSIIILAGSPSPSFYEVTLGWPGVTCIQLQEGTLSLRNPDLFKWAVSLPALVLGRHAIFIKLDREQTCPLEGDTISSKAILSTKVLEKIVPSKGRQCPCYKICEM